MEIKLVNVLVRDLVDGFVDKGEDGVFGYHEKLNIRPPYQREFIYDKKKSEAVIESIMNGFPLNTMYWAVNTDGSFEIIDGQQRTLSICKFVKEKGSIHYQDKYFDNLTDDEQQKILNYELTIYQCSGTPSEKLAWFQIINIAGVELSNQELRNAVYSGSWVSDAKRYFSKSNGPAYRLGKNYLSGSPIRQEYLETAIKWASYSDEKYRNAKDPIKEYMAQHQHDDNASALWSIFKKIIHWIESVYPVYDKYQKGIDWGELYWKYKDEVYDTDKLQKDAETLLGDYDVTNKKGVFIYLLTHQESVLSIRKFAEEQKKEAYIRQKGICPICGKHYELEEMEGDHIIPWSKGGRTVVENLQMLCKNCNRMKGSL